MIKIKDLRSNDDVMTLGRLKNAIDHFIETCRLNNINPSKVPVIVKDLISQDDYILHQCSMGFGKDSVVGLGFYGDDRDRIEYYEGEDKRPEGGGEFWKSRGPSSFDVSGFVVSKEAGERLLEMTKKVLGKEGCKTWLDWRKYEPNWIQFKFSAEEFDVGKINSLTKDGIVTEDILMECKLQ